jgi:hypothetical protein
VGDEPDGDAVAVREVSQRNRNKRRGVRDMRGD